MNYIYTLGPSLTNCEKAAREWSIKNNFDAQIVLFDTLEFALTSMIEKKQDNIVLLSCIVYPDLHKIVFDNLDLIEFKDVFMSNTYSMVYAVNNERDEIKTIATHPAPKLLVPNDQELEIILSTSNSKAALMCRNGEVDSCITTIIAAKENSLNIIKNFGEVTMGFAIHKLKNKCFQI